MSQSQNATNLLNWHHDDYEIAKRHIHQAIGSLDDIEVFGRQVLVAVYVRPNKTAKGFYQTTKAQMEDVYQGKSVLLLKAGPDAFVGDDGYVAAMFGSKGKPSPGDWLFVPASSGLSTWLIGDGAQRPQGEDFRNDPIDIYDWDGWPVRIIVDDAVIGRMNKPHQLV
jgi:hypothetical protein